MNYFPFHLGDYAAHTAHLEPMEDLAYRRMLDLYYRTEAPLPADWRDVARLIRMKDYGAEIEAVLSEFFTLTGDGWRHFRCDAEIERMQDKQAKAKASAAASVKARSTNAQRTLNERSTVVELPTPTPKEEEQPSAVIAAAKTQRALRKCPEGFKPEDQAGWVAKHCPGVDWRHETEKFRDHTFRNSISDWSGAWRNWMRKAFEGRPTLATPAASTVPSVAADKTAAFLAEQAKRDEATQTPEAHAARLAAMARLRKVAG